jgi:hypothetical protein
VSLRRMGQGGENGFLNRGSAVHKPARIAVYKLSKSQPGKANFPLSLNQMVLGRTYITPGPLSAGGGPFST